MVLQQKEVPLVMAEMEDSIVVEPSAVTIAVLDGLPTSLTIGACFAAMAWAEGADGKQRCQGCAVSNGVPGGSDNNGTGHRIPTSLIVRMVIFQHGLDKGLMRT